MFAILEGARSRRIYDHNEMVWLAWNSAAFARQKKLPPIKTFLLSDPRKVQRQPWQQQLAAAKLITQMFNGQPRKAK